MRAAVERYLACLSGSGFQESAALQMGLTTICDYLKWVEGEDIPQVVTFREMLLNNPIITPPKHPTLMVIGGDLSPEEATLIARANRPAVRIVQASAFGTVKTKMGAGNGRGKSRGKGRVKKPSPAQE
jgi:hypothetical protein